MWESQTKHVSPYSYVFYIFWLQAIYDERRKNVRIDTVNMVEALLRGNVASAANRRFKTWISVNSTVVGPIKLLATSHTRLRRHMMAHGLAQALYTSRDAEMFRKSNFMQILVLGPDCRGGRRNNIGDSNAWLII